MIQIESNMSDTCLSLLAMIIYDGISNVEPIQKMQKKLIYDNA